MQKIKGISFFCPAYYDGKNIGPLIDKAVDLFSHLCEDYEIVVINDGSPDNTGEILDKLASIYDKVKVIHHPRNLGYAEALKTGFKNANKFEFILFTDGDNQYNVDYFKDMIAYMKDYDAVFTYRVKNGNSYARRVISWVFNRLLNILYNEPFRDLSSAFRLVKREAINEVMGECKSSSIFLPIEIILRLHKKNYRIKEIPIESSMRLHGRSTSLLPKNFMAVIKEMFSLKIT